MREGTPLAVPREKGHGNLIIISSLHAGSDRAVSFAAMADGGDGGLCAKLACCLAMEDSSTGDALRVAVGVYFI